MDKVTTPQSDIGYFTFDDDKLLFERPGLTQEPAPTRSLVSQSNTNSDVEYQCLPSPSTPASHWQIVYTESLPIESSINALTLSSGEAVGGSSLEIDEDLQANISTDELSSIERERASNTRERTEISPLIEEPKSAAGRGTALAAVDVHPGLLSRSHDSLAPRSSITNAGYRLSSFDCRWHTFTHVPLTEADRLACQAGFFQTAADLDTLRCHSCRCRLKRNALPSDVWLLHARLSPTCRFVLEVRGSEYVDDCKGELTEQQRVAVVPQAGEITDTLPIDCVQDMHWNYTMGSHRVYLGGSYLPSAHFYHSDIPSSLAGRVQELVMERQTWLQRQEEMQQELKEMRAEVQVLRARLDETEDRSLTNESRGLVNRGIAIAHGNAIYNQSIELRQQRSKVEEHEYEIQESNQQVEELSDSITGMCDTVRAHELHIDKLRRSSNVLATTQLGIQARCQQHSTAINDLDRRVTTNSDSIKAVERQATVSAAAIDHVESEVTGIRRQARDDDSDEDAIG